VLANKSAVADRRAPGTVRIADERRITCPGGCGSSSCLRCGEVPPRLDRGHSLAVLHTAQCPRQRPLDRHSTQSSPSSSLQTPPPPAAAAAAAVEAGHRTGNWCCVGICSHCYSPHSLIVKGAYLDRPCRDVVGWSRPWIVAKRCVVGL